MGANSIGELSIGIIANSSPLAKEFGRTQQMTAGFARSINSVKPAGGSGGGGGAGMAVMTAGMTAAVTVGNLLAEGLTGVASAGIKAGVTAVKLAADYQDAGTAFRVMTGDVAIGAKLLADLEKFAADTPFGSAELIKSGKRLLGFGIDAGNVVPVINALGNVAAGTGSDFDKLALAFGQVVAKGRMMGGEILQFSEAGVGVQAFADAAGMGVAQFNAQMEQGRIGVDVMAKAFNTLTQEGGKFGGMMAELNKNVSGRWNNLTEAMSVGLKNVGLAFFEGFRPSELLTDAAKRIESLTSKTGGLVGIFKDVRVVFDAATATGQGFITTVWSRVEGAFKGVLPDVKTFEGTVDAAFDTAITGIGSLIDGFVQLRKEFAVNFLKPMAEALKAMGPGKKPDQPLHDKAFDRLGDVFGLKDMAGEMLVDQFVTPEQRQALETMRKGAAALGEAAGKMAANLEGGGGPGFGQDWAKNTKAARDAQRLAKQKRDVEDALKVGPIGALGKPTPTPDAMQFAQHAITGTLSPFGEFQKTMRLGGEASRFDLAPQGKIDSMLAKAFMDFDHAVNGLETRLPQALYAGSAEAQSLVTAALASDGRQNVQERIETVLKQARDIQKRQEDQLKEIADALKKQPEEGWF